MRLLTTVLILAMSISMFAGCAFKRYDEDGSILSSIELRLDENTLMTLQSTYTLLLDSYEQIAALRSQAIANNMQEEAARLQLDMEKRQARLVELQEAITLLAESIEAARAVVKQ